MKLIFDYTKEELYGELVSKSSEIKFLRQEVNRLLDIVEMHAKQNRSASSSADVNIKL